MRKNAKRRQVFGINHLLIIEWPLIEWIITTIIDVWVDKKNLLKVIFWWRFWLFVFFPWKLFLFSFLLTLTTMLFIMNNFLIASVLLSSNWGIYETFIKVERRQQISALFNIHNGKWQAEKGEKIYIDYRQVTSSEDFKTFLCNFHQGFNV